MFGPFANPIDAILGGEPHERRDPFRAVLIVGFLVILPIGLYYRIRSQATGERLDRRQEGLFILATLRPLGLALWLGIIAYMVDPSWMAWSQVPLPAWLRWMGAGVFALAAGLTLWTFKTLGKNLTDTVVTRKDHTLVTTGPYARVRHPFYDSGVLLMLGSALVAANWVLFAGGVLLFLLFIVRTRTEDEKLLARFGDSYRDYQKRTGASCPK